MEPCDTVTLNAAMRAVAWYLRANPLASDTAEGIHRWWLGDAHLSPSAVQQALDELARRGVLALQPAADGHRRFRLAASAGALDAFLRLDGDGHAPDA